MEDGEVKRALERALTRWLALERAGRGAAAEEALARVFSRLPLPAVPAGFADRVLARAARTLPVLARRPAQLALPARLAVAVCLALAGTSVLLLVPGALALAGELAGLLRPLELALGLLTGLAQRVGEGLAAWRALSEVGRLLSEIVASPPVLAALTAGLVASVGAFRLLQKMILPERSSRYAASI